MKPCLAALALSSLTLAGESADLPVHLEESHAGAFYHLVEALPLNEPHTLVLIDAHSDASGIADSDAVRAAIRRGPTQEKRAKMLSQWRREGRIQCYDWLEPLMPAPLAEVIWVPKIRLTPAEVQKLEQEAREYLDGHQEALPREAGPLAARYRVMDLETWEKETASWTSERRVVASVDLDFFAEMPDAELEPALDRVMGALLKQRGLVDVTAAISSPYLRDAAQAEKLMSLFLDIVWRVPQARVSFEPFAKTGRDRSLMARLRERRGEVSPAFDVASAGPFLRSLLLQNGSLENIQHEPARVGDLLQSWAEDPFLPRLEVHGALRRPDGTWSLEAKGDARLEIKPEPVGAKVRWLALRAEQASYRLSDTDLGFASNAPRWLKHRLEVIAEGSAMQSLRQSALLPRLDANLHCGTLEVLAEVIRDGQIYRIPSVTLCVRAQGSRGLRAAWSEQFGLPYLFDSRVLQRDWRTGPEARWGADCANFITQGLRTEGWLLPWGSPADVLPFLEPVEAGAMTAETLLHMGSHLAAVWEDRPPLGTLNGGDLCVHHLEGLPELISYERLSTGRRPARHMRIKPPRKPLKLIFTGDVMMGRSVGVSLNQDAQPMARLRAAFQGADAVFGNLECTLSKEAAKHTEERLRLVASPGAAAYLGGVGFTAVSLANNHTKDLGKVGFEETQRMCHEAGLRTLSDRMELFDLGGHKLALLAWDDSRQPETKPLLQKVREAGAVADFVIVMPHWGTEHRLEPDERQLRIAESLFEAGADLIVGSGPHVVQRLQHTRAGSVAFSLGNTVFDGPGPDAEWANGALLEVTLETDAERPQPVRARLIHTLCDNEGSVSLR